MRALSPDRRTPVRRTQSARTFVPVATPPQARVGLTAGFVYRTTPAMWIAVGWTPLPLSVRCMWRTNPMHNQTFKETAANGRLRVQR